MGYNHLNAFNLEGLPTHGPALDEWLRLRNPPAGPPARGTPAGQGKGVDPASTVPGILLPSAKAEPGGYNAWGKGQP
eukprot:14021786-Heterocapsa_arctica.AAC.1